jgi:hypothetical protein
VDRRKRLWRSITLQASRRQKQQQNDITRRKERHKQEAEEAKDHIPRRSTTLMFGM